MKLPRKTKMADLTIAGNRFDSYKWNANDAIHFKLVRTETDLEDDQTNFSPDMTHQLFGDSESIFGYQDLNIGIYCTAARMLTYVSIKYTDKINPEKCDGVSADDIHKVLNHRLQPGYITSLDDFTSRLPKDANFKPFGELTNAYTVTRGSEDRRFEIYKTDIEAPGFRDYHERLQPFLLFYVDAASYLDVDDDRWSYYLLFEKYKSNGNPMYAFAGYMTVYNYYAYPEKIRPRISQVLVLPPFQKMGHGASLIQTFYNECYSLPKVLDITVEDPSENFQRVRDYVDIKNALILPSFQPQCLLKGFSEDMVNEAKEKLKINRKQARRVYEILRLKETSPSESTKYRDYRLDVKRRLNLPFKKNGRDLEKLKRALNPNELTAMLNMNLEQKQDYLEKAFQELVIDYQRVIDRLDAD